MYILRPPSTTLSSALAVYAPRIQPRFFPNVTLLLSILLTPARSTGGSLSATLVHNLSNIQTPLPLSLSLCLIALCLYLSFYFCLRPSLSLCFCLSLCLSLSPPHSLSLSMCSFLVLARSLGSFHALTLAFACACALDLA